MKYYAHWDQGTPEEPVILTEGQILQNYWPYWEEQMVKKYGMMSDLISEANCIEDWVVVNWAWEVK